MMEWDGYPSNPSLGHCLITAYLSLFGTFETVKTADCDYVLLCGYGLYTGSVCRVTTFLDFWKCQGIWLRSGERPIVRERSGNFCSQGNFIVAAQQNNLPDLICTVIHFSNACSQRILINECATVWPIVCNFVWDFFSVCKTKHMPRWS